MIRKFAIAVAVMFCSMSAAWAGGNWNCQLQNGTSGPMYPGNGNTSDGACQDAARVACAVAVAPNAKLFACRPWPLDVPPGQTLTVNGNTAGICSDGACSVGATVNITQIASQSPANGNVRVVANSQQSTGTSWGPQYGADHVYRSIQGTTPDVIGFTGPEDGIVAIEVSAEQGVNNTGISNIALYDSTGTYTIGTVTHVTSSPDLWQISGTAAPLASYNLKVTFSHTGGYGQYAVKMNAAKAALPSPSYVQWTPALQFGGSSTGIAYSTQQGTCTNFGNQVTCEFYITLTSKGTATGSATLAGLPYADTTSIVAGGGLGQVLYSGLSSITAPVLVEVGFGAVNFEEQGIGAMTNSNFTNTSTVVGTFSYLKQ